jgi:hypothetical protein
VTQVLGRGVHLWGMDMAKRTGSMTKRGEGYVGAVELWSVFVLSSCSITTTTTRSPTI